MQCGPLNLTEEEENAAYSVLFDVYADLYTANSESCPRPCRTVHYEAIHRTSDANSNGYQMFLIFDPVVKIYKSQLIVDTLTLFTRLGGILGLCKNLIWGLLLLGGVITILRKTCPCSK